MLPHAAAGLDGSGPLELAEAAAGTAGQLLSHLAGRPFVQGCSVAVT